VNLRLDYKSFVSLAHKRSPENNIKQKKVADFTEGFNMCCKTVRVNIPEDKSPDYLEINFCPWFMPVILGSLGDRDQVGQSSKPANSFQKPILKNPITKN
jgi:hypothetical protein